IGIARLSRNWLISRLASAYVELMRNIPLLIQLFFWYALVTENAAGPRQAFNPLPGVFVSNRGIKLPWVAEAPGFDYLLYGLLLALAATLVVAHLSNRRREQTGRGLRTARIGLALFVVLPLGGWLLGGAPTALDV